jgi:hypothetical protein
MRIVIELDGPGVTATGPEGARGRVEGALPMVGDRPPADAPAELLARARKLGALSAGAARIGPGAALASASLAAPPAEAPAVAPSKGRRKRKSE